MNIYDVYNIENKLVLSGDSRKVSEFFGIKQHTMSDLVNRKTKKLYRDKYIITVRKKEDEKMKDSYLKMIEEHLDKFGNTIITRSRLKRRSLEEIMEQLKSDGYKMKEPRKAINLEGKPKNDYWVIEGRKVVKK